MCFSTFIIKVFSLHWVLIRTEQLILMIREVKTSMTVCCWSSQEPQILLNWMTEDACIVSPQSLLSECVRIYRWTMNRPCLPDTILRKVASTISFHLPSLFHLHSFITFLFVILYTLLSILSLLLKK